MRLAMWSGPRNLSTAMMYAFAQRRDFHVVDEPFYGPYLRQTGLAHPMREAVLADRPEDAFAVEQSLIGPIPDGKRHVYHKHMCQHMVEGIPRGFIASCVNVFLLRHPARVVASFMKGYPETTDADIGFDLQWTLFRHVQGLSQTPIVLDSADIRDNPEAMLRALCENLGLDWDKAMLSWPKGPKPYDGVWAPVWYKTLHETTGFAGPEGPLPRLDGRAAAMAERAMAPYEALSQFKLSPA